MRAGRSNVEDVVEIGDRLTILVTMPFWLDNATRPCFPQSPEEKTAAFRQLADAINDIAASREGIGSVRFEAMNLELAGTYPDGLARRKGAVIVSNDVAPLLPHLRSGIDGVLAENGVPHADHSCRVVYYDYGAGYVEYRVVRQIADAKDAIGMARSYQAIIYDQILPYQETRPDLPEVTIDAILTCVDDAIVSDRKGAIPGFPNWLLAEQNARSRTTWAFCASILSTQSAQAVTVSVPTSTLHALRNNITKGTGDEGAPRYEEFPGEYRLCAAHGETGSFIVALSLAAAADERRRLTDRLTNFVNLSWMKACLLLEAVEAAHTKEVIYFGDRISADRLIENTQKVRRARDLLQVLTFEARPMAMCALAHDSYLYDGIFAESEMQTSIDLVDRAIQKFDSLVEEIKIYESIRIRNLLGMGALFGGILGIVATIVGVLSYIDVATPDDMDIGGKFDSMLNVRSFIVGMAFVLALFIMGVFYRITKKMIIYSRFWEDDGPGIRRAVRRFARGSR